MKEKRYHLAMDERERSIMIHALNDYRNDLIDENRAPDAVEDLILNTAGTGIGYLIYLGARRWAVNSSEFH